MKSVYEQDKLRFIFGLMVFIGSLINIIHDEKIYNLMGIIGITFCYLLLMMNKLDRIEDKLDLK